MQYLNAVLRFKSIFGSLSVVNLQFNSAANKSEMQSSKSPVQQEETTQQWKVQVTEGEEERSPEAVDIDTRRPLSSPHEGRSLPDPEENKPPPPSTSVSDRRPLSCPDEIPLPTTSTSEGRSLPSTLAIYTEIPEIPEDCVHSYSNAQRTLDGYVKPQCEQCGIRQAKGEM